MRLLNATTRRLEEFTDHELPKYAILSHTWQKDEVSFRDIHTSKATDKKGYVKIRSSCKRALRDRLKYVWVDTCCIDKRSSAELSEAINSMMSWYEHSEVCYVYLADVPPSSELVSDLSSFKQSRWFTRGWTLQELLAPPKLVFLAQDWSLLFARETVAGTISELTGISASFLEVRENRGGFRHMLNSRSIAERMSWASKRKTSRYEDIAYSLLGIFGITMPILYGEGANAFFRLQQEIMKHSDDQSLFSWNFVEYNNESGNNRPTTRLVSVDQAMMISVHNPERSGVLASCPAAFSQCGDIVPCNVGKPTPPFSITNKGLSMEIPLLTTGDTSVALLQCQFKKDPTTLLALPVDCLQDNIYARAKSPICVVGHKTWQEWPQTQLYLAPSPEFISNRVEAPEYTVIMKTVPSDLRIGDVLTYFPPQELGSMVLMECNRSSKFCAESREVFVRFESRNGDCQPFILGFHLTLKPSRPSILSLNIQPRDNAVPTCRFLPLRKTDYPSLEALQQWMQSTLHQAQKGEPSIPYSANVATETLFGKRLFSIHVTSARASRQRRHMGEYTLSDLASFLHRIATGHPHVHGLRQRWLHVLKAYHAHSIPYFRSLFRIAVLSPLILTFLIDILARRSFAQAIRMTKFLWRNEEVPALLAWPVYLLFEYSSIKELINKGTPRYVHGKNAMRVLFLYICCRCLPAHFLLDLIGEEG
ncbi:hypothetical protein MW887_009361 [Aspergillus wentii]|nr:hypothetical protein MW887_009361 [Aspergillus wentii]